MQQQVGSAELVTLTAVCHTHRRHTALLLLLLLLPASRADLPHLHLGAAATLDVVYRVLDDLGLGDQHIHTARVASGKQQHCFCQCVTKPSSV